MANVVLRVDRRPVQLSTDRRPVRLAIAAGRGARGGKGDPGGNAMAVGLFADLVDLNIPVGTNLVRTTGWNVQDRGGAHYVDATGETLDAGGEGVWWAVTANARQFKLSEAVPNAQMFGAQGDDTNDDAPPLQAFLNYVSAVGTALGGRAPGLIPAGKYRCATGAGPVSCILVKQNSAIVNGGEIIHDAGGGIGGTVQVARSQDNISWTGGVINANFQGNDNCIAISGLDSNGGQAEGIWISDVTLRNARHGGDFIPDPDDPSDVGRGGGKGFSVQAGPQRVFISRVLIEDCDIGFSVEGIISNGGNTNDVNISDIAVRGSKYMGMLLAGYTPEPESQTITSVNLSNIYLDGCCVGQAENFGVIHGAVAVGVVGRNIRIRNESGAAVTPIRGTFRQCDLEVQGDCYAVADLIDLHNGGGYANQPTQSQNLRLVVTLKARTAPTGWVLNMDDDYILRRSRLDLSWLIFDGSDLTNNPWGGAGLFAVQPQRTSYRLEDLSTTTTGGAVAQSQTDEAPVFGQAGYNDMTAATVVSAQVRTARGIVSVPASNVPAVMLAAADIPDRISMDLHVRSSGGTVSWSGTVQKAATGGTTTLAQSGGTGITLAVDGSHNITIAANVGLVNMTWFTRVYGEF